MGPHPNDEVLMKMLRMSRDPSETRLGSAKG
jgi:hypothetical protein